MYYAKLEYYILCTIITLLIVLVKITEQLYFCCGVVALQMHFLRENATRCKSLIGVLIDASIRKRGESIRNETRSFGFQIQNKSPIPTRIPAAISISPERTETNTTVVAQQESSRMVARGTGAQSPSSPPPPSGKYSLMQFAMQNFRQTSE